MVEYIPFATTLMSNASGFLKSPKNLIGMTLCGATWLAGSTLIHKSMQSDSAHDFILQKYPNIRSNVDVAYLIEQIYNFEPYVRGNVRRLMILSEKFMGLYQRFNEAQPHRLAAYLQKMSFYQTDVTKELNQIETQLCTIHQKLFEKFEPYKMELEQCLDQLLQNKMMDFEVVMDDLPFSDDESCDSGYGTDGEEDDYTDDASSDSDHSNA